LPRTDGTRVISFRQTGRRERLVLSPHPILTGTPVRIGSQDRALALLRELGRDTWAMAALRRLHAEALGRASICGMSDEAVLSALALRLATGELKVRSVDVPLATVPAGAVLDAPPPPSPAAPQPAEQSTWFEVQVLFADTGAPVPKLRLKIKLPKGDTADHTTDDAGLIRIDGIKKAGECTVSSDVKGAKRAEAVLLAGAPPSAPLPGGDKPSGNATYKLVQVEAHKAKTGDTLDALARSVNTTWKELAVFNWGTDKPKEVNKHLRWDVGCTKKSGQSYVFDDSDVPGIIMLPKPVELKALTGDRLILGVEKAAKSRPWIFSL
jgi:hypothetical protein